MFEENKESLGNPTRQSCLSESMECINLQTPVNFIMKITIPTNNNNNGIIIIIIIILEELFNSTLFVYKNRHYYMAILLLRHIQKRKFVSHHNLAM
jgi:hypothetical protein